MIEVQAERVLVVPTRLFHALGHFQGFSPDVARYLPELLSLEHTRYLPRHDVEEDPSFKQLIPYVIFRYRDKQGTTSLFQYTRGRGQGEGRLHSKRSVGIGGHISAQDGAGPTGTAYTEGMRREIEEEVEIGTPYVDSCVGMINDDETPVGAVHLGVVHLCDVETPSIRPRETDIADSGFQPVEDLLADLDRFETWSQICLKALFGR